MLGGGRGEGGLSGTPMTFPWDERGQWKQPGAGGSQSEATGLHWETGLHQTPPLKRGHTFK